VRNVTVWTEQQKLTASDDTAGDEFGRSVGVSGDTAVVGAPRDDDQNGDAGSAYVFARYDASWVELHELFAQNASGNDHFGSSVAISSDAVLVGAPDDSGSQGEAFVFARLGVEWPRVMRLRASDGDGGGLRQRGRDHGGRSPSAHRWTTI
jgi:hypothetical protein